jgi:hypothetical protein
LRDRPLRFCQTQSILYSISQLDRVQEVQVWPPISA